MHGEKNEQHYNYLGCTAYARLYKSQKEGATTMKTAKVGFDHTANHETTEKNEEYENAILDEDDRDLIRTLKEANAKPSQIKRRKEEQIYIYPTFEILD